MYGPKYAIFKVLRFMTIFLALAYNIMIPIFFGVELFQNISKMDINVMVQQFIVFGWMFLSVAKHFNLLIRHTQLVIFFKDFKTSLEPMNNMRFLRKTLRHKDSFKNYLVLTYLLYLAIMLLFIVMDSSQLISVISSTSAEDVNDFTGILTLVIRVLRSVSDVYSSFFTGLADIIPIFIYYHAATAVELLIQQWQSVASLILERGKKSTNQHQLMGSQSADSVFEQEIYQISRLYDSIVQLVFRANHLFGYFIILSKGLSVFVICCYAPALINSSQNNELFHPFGPFIFSVFIFRLVWPIFMSSKLYTSAARLRSTVLSSKSQANLNDFLPSEEKAVNFLLTQLQDDKLAACPMGLYSITPSIFLTLLNVIATYVIIILQAAGQANGDPKP